MGGKSVAGFFDQTPGFPVSGGAGGQSQAIAHGDCGLFGYGGATRLLVPGAPRPSTARRDREHDKTEPNHHHTHEFEGKGVHGNSPQ
jgi:hypothetical protein